MRNTQDILIEAYRLFEMFAVRRDRKEWTIEHLTTCWTGLMFPSVAKRAVEAGIVRPHSKEHFRCLGWYCLTEKGAEIVLKWHKAGGIKFDSYQPLTYVPNWKAQIQ